MPAMSLTVNIQKWHASSTYSLLVLEAFVYSMTNVTCTYHIMHKMYKFITLFLFSTYDRCYMHVSIHKIPSFVVVGVFF